MQSKNRPCWVEISAPSFERNYRFLTQAALPDAAENAAAPGQAGVHLLAIVKANAYGHGLEICAPAAVRAGAQWLGVTSVEEGAAARSACPEAEILVISGPFAGQGADVLKYHLTPVVWEGWQLEELANAARDAGCGAQSVPVHLELDTGMSRQGAGPAELDAFLVQLQKHPALRLDGLMTHLYAADESDGVITREQFTQLDRLLDRLSATAFRPKWLHVGNSAAVLEGHALLALREIGARHGLQPMVRPGLALYGLAPQFSPQEPASLAEMRGSLRPVLSWKTQVVSVRAVAPGQTVGYNGTFVVTEPMKIALLAVGYADGLRRALSNRGAVLIRGQRAPIIGRISMDQTVVDVTDIPGVIQEDEVVLLGEQGSERISAEEHAAWAGTVSWEIFTSIAERVERKPV